MRGHIDDLTAEDIGGTLDLIAVGTIGTHLDQHDFALDMIAIAQVAYFQYIHQLVQLLGDLLDDAIITGSNYGHPRQGRIFGRRHRQGLDVVSPLGKQAHYPAQGAGFVFQQQGYNTPHQVLSVLLNHISSMAPVLICMG